MESWPTVVSALIGYWLGAIQTAFFVGQYTKKIDIRRHGSNNAGASNVTTVLGWKYGIFTAAVDVLKGIVAVLIVRWLFEGDITLQYVAGGLAVIGHIFPSYLQFSGGKGAATLIGIAWAIDWQMGIALIGTIVLLTIITDYVAIGSIAMFTLFAALTHLKGYSSIAVGIAILLMGISFYKHWINIRRIIAKEERGLRSVIGKR